MDHSNLLIDTNVILDVLQNRAQFIESSKKVIALIYEGKYKGVIAAHSITNLWYVLRKFFTQEKRRELVMTLMKYFQVSCLDKQKLIDGLQRSDFLDFEDCLQDECAMEFNADFIITRNTKDFKNSKVPAVTPEEFLKLKEI